MQNVSLNDKCLRTRVGRQGNRGGETRRRSRERGLRVARILPVPSGRHGSTAYSVLCLAAHLSLEEVGIRVREKRRETGEEKGETKRDEGGRQEREEETRDVYLGTVVW